MLVYRLIHGNYVFICYVRRLTLNCRIDNNITKIQNDGNNDVKSYRMVEFQLLGNKLKAGRWNANIRTMREIADFGKKVYSDSNLSLICIERFLVSWLLPNSMLAPVYNRTLQRFHGTALCKITKRTDKIRRPKIYIYIHKTKNKH